ncbi:uncharacterized protein LOC114515601 [Dendronephthya gigantea]|uniref:uncharacterized protein LOC114515601 n=1 Tax=Dendronephthya gigantea TaxID=151771 RepID=UPI00106C2493|nr:uncharacterized protein LOC114515601 [Dendronephthya gigantea]
MPRFTECWRCGNSSATVACPSCDVAKYCSKKCKANDIARHKDAECRPVAIIKTCSSCRKTGSSLQTCSGCYRAFYCDAKCQMNHRSEHKFECKRIVDKIKSLAGSLLAFFPNSGRICMAHYYWGNMPAYDYLNLLENEGVNYDSDMNVLVLGVGDLRNIVLTCASLPESFANKVKFVLNDIDEWVLARLVLLLYMMIKCDRSVSKVVTEIWYSLSLSEKTYNYLHQTLQGLLRLQSAEDMKTATDGIIHLNEEHFRKFRDVWARWLEMRVEGTSHIRKQREKAMNADLGSFGGRINYYNCIPKEHVPSAMEYMEKGVFNRTQNCSFAENPTLTGPPMFGNDLTYCCPTSVLPFVGWDYVEVEKSTYSKSLVTMFGNYIEEKLERFMEKLAARQVRFDIILGNCMNIEEFLTEEEKYDRIFTSNLMDYILLPELLRLYSGRLNRNNPHTTLITETQNWVNFCPAADVDSMSIFEQRASFGETALRDTNDPKFANDVGTTFREYLDNSRELQDYLRALFYADRKRQKCGTSTPSKVPNFRELGNEFQLRLRDGFRNENRIVFLKPAVNRRRVTMITGLERNMEWVPN